MSTLIVSLERSGRLMPVGLIFGEKSSDARFQYSANYLRDPQSVALSIHFPLRKDPYSATQTAAFFEGLLPEGFTRRSVAQWMPAAWAIPVRRQRNRS